MICKLVNLGRGSFNGTIDVKNQKQLRAVVESHLLSREVDITPTADPGVYDVIVGGFRKVGEIEILHERYHQN